MTRWLESAAFAALLLSSTHPPESQLPVNPGVVAHMEQLLARGQKDLNDPARCRPAGKAEPPLKFLIPRPGEETHIPVKRIRKE
jgi:hypothetical protein